MSATNKMRNPQQRKPIEVGPAASTPELYRPIVTFLHLVGVSADVARLAHRHAWPNDGPDSLAMVWALQSLHLSVEYNCTPFKKLTQGPWPTLARTPDGHWCLIGYANKDGLVVQTRDSSNPQPLFWGQFTEWMEPLTHVEWITAKPPPGRLLR